MANSAHLPTAAGIDHDQRLATRYNIMNNDLLQDTNHPRLCFVKDEIVDFVVAVDEG